METCNIGLAFGVVNKEQQYEYFLVWDLLLVRLVCLQIKPVRVKVLVCVRVILSANRPIRRVVLNTTEAGDILSLHSCY